MKNVISASAFIRRQRNRFDKEKVKIHVSKRTPNSAQRKSSKYLLHTVDDERGRVFTANWLCNIINILVPRNMYLYVGNFIVAEIELTTIRLISR